MPPLFNFTLNCVICFDPFNDQEQYPVILPCGHTFVCNECASRLDNCHECRQSLFVEPKQAQAQAIVDLSVLFDDEMPKWYKPLPPRPSARERHRVQSFRKKKAKAPEEVVLEPIRLPLPKNLVLLEMIGVAKATMKKSQGQVDEDQCAEMTAEEGIRALTSECGTYVVKDTLQILRERPAEMEEAIACRDKTAARPANRDDISWKSQGILKSLSPRRKKKSSPDSNKKSSPRARARRLGLKGGVSRSIEPDDECNDLSSVASTIPPEIENLEPGDYVHVVAFDNGIAKLARRRGYVHARPEQLVKVAGPQDDVVAIEGQLCAMINKRKTCLQDLVDMKKERTKLLLRLKLAILEEETRKTEGSDLFVESFDNLDSLDEHYKASDLPIELLALQKSTSSGQNSPRCASSIATELQINTNTESREGLPPPPPSAASAPPPRMPFLEVEEDDDLGKQAAKIEAIRKEYESTSFFCGLCI